MSRTMNLENARAYVRQCQEECAKIDALPPGPERQRRLAAVLDYIETRGVRIPADIRRQALED